MFLFHAAKSVFILHLLLVFYSISSILSKFAGKYELFSLPFFVLYGAVLLILGIYAIGWQQVLKRLPLTTAFANKAITVVWGLVWGVLIFGEVVNAGKIIAAALIMAGIVLFSADKNEEEAC